MNKERLLKLAEHLDKGKLGHKRFDFRVFNSNVEYKLKKKAPIYSEPGGNVCGTNGCAIGELPFVFPDAVEFSHAGIRFHNRTEDVCSFFGIDFHEKYFLFFPREYSSDFSRLPARAGRHQVAAHIRKFVANGGIYVTK